MQPQIFNAPNFLVWFRVWRNDDQEKCWPVVIGQAVNRRYLAKTVIDCYKELLNRYPLETHTVMFLHVSDDANRVDVTLQHDLTDEIANLL